MSDIVCIVSFYIKCQPTVFIVFSYRRLSDVMCADRHWKLVYRWISAHITLLAEHTPISGSFMFLLCNQSSVSSALSVFSKKKIRGYPCHPWEKKKPPRALHTKRLFNGYRYRYQATCLLVYSFTCQLNNLLVYLSTNNFYTCCSYLHDYHARC